MFVESDDAFLKSHTYCIERFSKHFSELSQSHQSFLADWSFLINNALIANVNFKESSSLRSSCEAELHWRTFQRVDISTEASRASSQCRISLRWLIWSSVFSCTCSYKVLLLKTSYEHQDNVSKWHISDVFEEHSSILVVNVICHEHDFISLDHHRIVKNIDQLMSERNLIYKSIQIISKWIITIWIVNHVSS
jgi:hypothetical protein